MGPYFAKNLDDALNNTQLYADSIPFTDLMVSLKLSDLHTPKYQQLLKNLEQYPLQILNLVFLEEEIQDRGALTETLITTTLPYIHYPVVIYKENSTHEITLDKDEAFHRFYDPIIEKIHHQRGLSAIVNETSTLDPLVESDLVNYSTKTIQLKSLIKKKEHSAMFDHLIRLEERFEIIEQHEEVEEVEETVEVQAEAQGVFEAELIDFEKFHQPPYSNFIDDDLYKIFEQELFGNLPKGIKYTSHEAAVVLAKNAGAYATLNADNLPEGFILKKTPRGELVLDYSQDEVENHVGNVFTPKPAYSISEDLIYDHRELPQHLVNELESIGIKGGALKCHNLWIKYGDEGVLLLIKTLKKCEEDSPGLNDFIQKNYLQRFPQWDVFLDDKDALTSWLVMSTYSPLKLACLKEFWPNDQYTTFKLTDILAGYEKFWKEWEILADKNNIDHAEILGAWEKPKGGHPVVHMERLLTILKNARSLSEQLILQEKTSFTLLHAPEKETQLTRLLDKKPTLIKQGGQYFLYGYHESRGMWVLTELNAQLVEQEALAFPKEAGYSWERNDKQQASLTRKDSPLFQEIKRQKAFGREDKISLVNYGAYYASKYEDYQIVTKEMAFVYDPKIQNQWIFNPEGSVYRVSLSELVDDYSTLYSKNDIDEISPLLKTPRFSNDARIRRICRCIGQSKQGIDARYFIFALNKYLSGYDDWYRNNKINVAMISLFFLIHERYEGKIEPYRLLMMLDRLECHPHVLDKTIHSLDLLFKKDTYLSDLEGYAMTSRVAQMNSAEFEGLNFDKDHYIEKLFDQFFTNKQPTLKCIRKLAENEYSKWPFVYALDTAEYLSKDTTIQVYYRGSLLLFTTLLNSEYKESYYEGSNDPEMLSRLEEIKAFLSQAATQKEPNNYQYAYQRMINANQYFTYKNCIAVYHDLKSVNEFDPARVDSILTKHGFTLHADAPKVFSRDNQDIKETLVSLVMALERYQECGEISFTPPSDVPQAQIDEIQAQISVQSSATQDDSIPVPSEDLEVLQNTLRTLQAQREKAQAWNEQFILYNKKDFKSLQLELNEQWHRSGTLLTYTAKSVLKPIFDQLLDGIFNQELARLPQSEFSEKFISKISQMPAFNETSDFEKFDEISNQVSKIVDLWVVIQSRDNFKQQEELLTNIIISSADFNTYDYETLYALSDTLLQMPEREYLGILKTYFIVSARLDSKDRQNLLGLIQKMSNGGFPSSYIERFIHFYSETNPVQAQSFYFQIQALFLDDPHDPVLTYLFETESLSFADCETISKLTAAIKTPRFAIVELFRDLKEEQRNNCLQTLLDCSPEVLQIMAMSYAVTTNAVREKDPIDISQLARDLKRLDQDKLKKLYQLFEQSRVNLPCLSVNLSDFINSKCEKPFEDLKSALEKSPFGQRPLDEQFDITQVERVVNGFIDMNNQSMYPYHYRKQLMESFLFINRAGLDLPIYNNKPAKDLSNQELQDLFKGVKNKQPANLDDFQRRLFALGLLREIMYRTTGQFPYSTQMLSLIDCMMHQGDVINNIDTGQGKSLTDMLKASLLWLESDRVDLSTSSLVDAKRDLEFYDLYLNFLNISHSTRPLTTTSPTDDFKRYGLNVSTLAQFSLVDSKAQAEGRGLDSPEDVVSLVLNESDDAILDDRTVYRYASTDASVGLTEKQEWVYDAINEFVQSSRFIIGNTTEAQDIQMLRQYLLNEAKERKKSPRFIRDKLSDAQLLEWIESAILVNYRLRENFDYVLTETPILKMIRGVQRETYAVKILQKNGKVSSDTQYGNGMQQLLYSKLNKAYGEQRFIIEPESKTIISSNNKNRIDYYRARRGFIWGSSGTVGFGSEIDLQYGKFGFEFSKVAPHQAKQVKENDPIVCPNEEEQFQAILNKINDNLLENSKLPNFLFLKDIETAKRFHAYLKSKPDAENFSHQLFTGLGQEEEVIRKAGLPGMLTITTQALGRNTDVKYPKEGMNLIDTFVSQERNRIQRIGRTGRQGSKGRIDSIYNAADLNGQTIEALQKGIEEAAEIERRYNEDLFDVIGYFLSHVNQCEKERTFFKDHWSFFSQSIETRYHMEKLNKTYDRDRFLEEAVRQFNLLPIKHVDLTEFKLKLTEHYKDRRRYASYSKEVKLKDCIAPEWIAYHFLNEDARLVSQETYTKEGVKAKLKEIFDSMHKKDFKVLNIEYLRYLNAAPQSRALIKEAHQEFLKDYLKTQAHFSKQLSWIKRWMGFGGHLNRITQDAQYLLMFKAMVDVRHEETAFDEVKIALKTLLEEYTQDYWFVNKNRKQEIGLLIDKIEKTTNYKDLINAVMASKLGMMQQDIDENKSRWRSIKSLHFFGDSRFQSVLDRALKLASTMGQQQIASEDVEKMLEKLKLTLDGNLDEEKAQQTIDELKKMMSTLHPKDRANATVIAKSIEFALENNRLHQNGPSMTGRQKPEKG